MDDFFHHKNQPHPPSLSKAGKLRLGTKSDLLHYLQEILPVSKQCPEVTCVILDGDTTVQRLKPADNIETFGHYAEEVFIPFVFSLYKSAT